MLKPFTPAARLEGDDVLAAHNLEYAAQIARKIEDGVRQGLGMWVSELEPVLIYEGRSIYPSGITAKGHTKAYITFAWIKADGR